MENVFIRLLDRRGRILWISEDTDKVFWANKPIVEFADDSHRDWVEDSFARCVVRGEAIEFVARWQLPGADDSVWCLSQALPIDTQDGLMVSAAAVLVQSMLPDNYPEFTQMDREMLDLLASDNTIKEIAEKVERSESAIDNRIRGLKTKMGKNTLHGLVAGAMRGLLLHPGLLGSQPQPR